MVTQVPNIERDKLVAAIEQMRRNTPIMAEYAVLNAQMKRAQYLAYVEQGFTDIQALELCK